MSYQQPPAAPISSAADSLGWPFRDPQWVTKILLQGLIFIIPVVGWAAAFGWMSSTIANLRQGRQEMAPAGFDNLGKGFVLLVVYLVYAVLIFVAFGILAGLGAALVNSGSRGLAPIGALLVALGYLWIFVVSLGLQFLSPTIVLETDRGGFGAGLNIPRIINLATANPGVVLMAGLFAFLAYLISQFGSIACFVGIFFTTIWALAVLAGLVHWLEVTLPGAQRS